MAGLLRHLRGRKQLIQHISARSCLWVSALAGQSRHFDLWRGTVLQSRALHAASALRKDNEPFYEKYKDKLERAPARLGQLLKAKAKTKPAEVQPMDAHPAAYYTYQAAPSLESVMHISMVADKTPEEVGEIWREYHRTKDSVSAVILAEKYVEQHAKAMYCPFFVHPLPRDEGYEFFYSQFSGHRCFFTSLINYQMFQENAPPCLTLSHYTEFQESKGIVLMAGEVDTTVLTSLEAQFLVNQLQLYYASSDQARYGQLKTFNHNPGDFDYHLLIKQLEDSGIHLQRTAEPEQ